MHSRYGKFKICNHYSCLIGTVAMLLLIYLNLIFSFPKYLIVFPSICVVIFMYLNVYPYFEKFSIGQNSIVVKTINNVENINIPLDCTLIISYAAIYRPIGIPVFLKKKYAVSLVGNLSIDYIIDKLNEKKLIKYSNVSIEHLFYKHFIYSFVLEQEIFNKMVALRNFNVIKQSQDGRWRELKQCYPGDDSVEHK